MRDAWVDEYDDERYGAAPAERSVPRRQPARRPSRTRAGRVLQAVSGAVAAGVVVLAVGVSVAAYLGARNGFPGPGAVSVTAHLVGAVAVLAAQWFADHRRGPAAAAGSITVFFVTLLLLWTQWWG